MSQVYNIYCDESCHLERDSNSVMALGAIWCSAEKRREIADRLREIKGRHNLAVDFELKWTKVSKGKLQFYKDCLDYFFDDDDLHFRILIVPDKGLLRHEEFNQDHDTWYYKMYFEMIRTILDPRSQYRIYLDIKDTLGASKVDRLHKVLSNNMYDFSRSVIRGIQTIRSHEAEQMQLADLLIGAVVYANRGLKSSESKLALVERMRQRSRYDLTRTTLLREQKVNIFKWRAQSD